jgi:hypothetical protein
MIPSHLERRFPKLAADGGRKTSEAEPQYNCLSWSAKRTKKYRLEPKPVDPWDYWPKGVPNDYSLESFIVLFEKSGYERCEKLDTTFSVFNKKVAIYAAFGIYNQPRWEFTHVSDELHSGVWTSKLGYEEDIQHNTPQSLGGNDADEYGQIYKILKKRCWPWEVLFRLYFKIAMIFENHANII